VERIFDSRGRVSVVGGVLVTVLVVDVDDDEVVVVVSPAIDVEDLGCCAAIGIATGLDGEPGRRHQDDRGRGEPRRYAARGTVSLRP